MNEANLNSIPQKTYFESDSSDDDSAEDDAEENICAVETELSVIE
jgi:hypothetical protein